MTSLMKALSLLVSKHVPMHKARNDSMVRMIFGLIKLGSVQLTSLARTFDSQAKTSSTTRRIQRFFQSQDIKLEQIARLIIAIIPLPVEIILTLDRTNWKFGSKEINFLTVAFVFKSASIPIFWKLLDHKGNSDTAQRIEILSKVLEILGERKIHCLLADREFIGEDWFNWLKDNDIPLCIRIRNTHKIRHKNGGLVQIKFLCNDLKPNEFKVFKNVRFGNQRLNVTCLKLETEFLILASSPSIEALSLAIYRKRWTIECLFKDMKTNGFNLESTHVKDSSKLIKLFALCAVAFAWSVKAGAIKNEIAPIKIKSHKRPAFSLFTYGFQAIQSWMFKSRLTPLLKKLVKLLVTDLLRVT